MFNITTLRNDIAMMRLETEVMYNEYVQPICLWPQENTDKDLIIGLDGIVIYLFL